MAPESTDEVITAVEGLAASTDFSGVVRIDRGGAVFARAYGLAHRPGGLPNTVETRFAIASGTKPLTALTIMALVGEGACALDAPARSFLGHDLPLIEPDVTVEHLLAHRSGIGDYLDEDTDLDVNDYLLPVSPHRLVTTEDYLLVLDGHPPKFRAGARFSYCNSGYVVLALIAERVAGTPFHDLVDGRVCAPAGMTSTAFLRSDELPSGTATGYLERDGDRTNVLHLPVRGNGDGGIYTTADDIHSLWSALFEGRIIPAEPFAQMVHPHSELPDSTTAYGWGFWLDPSRGEIWIEGSDAGVSFRSTRLPGDDVTHTVISNTSDGAWPLVRLLRDAFRRT